MKDSINKKLLLNIIKTNKYITSILLLFITNFFFIVIYASGISYFKGAFYLLGNTNYLIIIMTIILLNTINIINIFENYKNIIIRFENKEKYLKEMLKIIAIINIITLLINYLMMFLILPLIISYFENSQSFYGIQDFIYSLYWTIKNISIITIISIFFALIYKNFNKTIAIFINILIISSLFVGTYNDIIVSSFKNLFINFSDYLSFHKYTSFSLEISLLTFYMAILLSIILIGIKITSKRIKGIGL